MSWKGWGKPWRKGNGADGYSSAASYYASDAGTGKGNWAEEKQGYKKKEDAKPSFPSYNQQQQSSIVVIAEKNHPPLAGTNEEDIIKEIQRAVNAARKAEQKVAKLQADLHKGQAQWRSYEQALKKAYAAERIKYQNDQTKLRQDLAEAMAAQAATRGALRSAAVGQLRDPETPTALPDAEMDDAWMALMKDTSYVEEVEQNRELDGWIREELDKIGSPNTAAAAKAKILAAMRGDSVIAASEKVSTPLRPTRTGLPSPSKGDLDNVDKKGERTARALFPFGCPPGRAKMEELSMTTKATQYQSGSPAVMDPYMASPSWETGKLPDVGGLTPQASKHRKSPRTGVKDVARPKGPAATCEAGLKPSLADKLMAARNSGAHSLHGASSRAPPSNIFIDDDQDHLGVPVPSGSDLDLLDG